MSSLVTVVVTVYNHQQYITECLTSIFNQTYQNIELIIINDGSTDQSSNIIESLLEESPFEHTEYINQENQGLVNARNNAFPLVNGEFLLFVDSDNFLDDTYIEDLLSRLILTGADIAYGDLYDPVKKEVFLKSEPFQLDTLLFGNYIDSCSLIRTKVIGDVRYDINLNHKKLEDYDFFLQLIINNGAKPIYCSDVKLNYRVLETSLSRKGVHSEEEYYNELYFYIMKKHLLQKPNLVYSATQKHMEIIQSRLDDLTIHLFKLTDYVHELEQKNRNLDKINDNLTTEKSNLTGNLKQSNNKNKELTESLENLSLEYEELSKENNDRKQKISDLNVINKELENQKAQILNSKSYRIGNFFIKPTRFAIKVFKDPRNLRPIFGRMKRFILRKGMVFKNPTRYYYKIAKIKKRKSNKYLNPSRILIFVIYENKPQLQQYKYIFLEALVKLCDKVLIVVNGTLPENDTARLKSLGEVVFRDNTGYDTAAFKFGIQYLEKQDLSKYDELLLVNDTNIGPFADLANVFENMAQKKVDFWGLTYGEAQPDNTGYNKYGRIPLHLQSFFLVIEKSMFTDSAFYSYWENMKDTNSREKAIGRHETVFTTHFENLGFTHAAITEDNADSAIYIHPLKMLKQGIPVVKFTALSNYDDNKFLWQGLVRETEIPEMLEYIKENTDYPISVINQIIEELKFEDQKHNQHILIIDGVENVLPQLTKYRVDNKVEQLQSLGYNVKKVNLSSFEMKDGEFASHIIIYRANFNDTLAFLCNAAKKANKPVLYDIDDLVIDTKYTDQLSYTQQISASEKRNYDASVNSYGSMLKLCDGAITTTQKLKDELMNYQELVLLNRNLANRELVEISSKHLHVHDEGQLVKIGYFSGSITHNENFEMIRSDLIQLMLDYKNVELHLVGYLDIPEDFKPFENRIVTHDFVEWQALPALISKVDINLAPLVDSVFNEAKSEIKWLEAALVNVPTVASNIGAFKEMIEPGVTGILVDEDWYQALKSLVEEPRERMKIAEQARDYVLKNCTTNQVEDELTDYLK